MSYIKYPLPLYYDKIGAIAQVKELRSHQRSKHVLRHFYLIREIIGRAVVKIEQIPTNRNIANLLTKPLSQRQYDSHVSSYDLRHVSNWL